MLPTTLEYICDEIDCRFHVALRIASLKLMTVLCTNVKYRASQGSTDSVGKDGSFQRLETVAWRVQHRREISGKAEPRSTLFGVYDQPRDTKTD